MTSSQLGNSQPINKSVIREKALGILIQEQRIQAGASLDKDDLARIALQFLKSDPDPEAASSVAAMLTVDRHYYPHLIDAALLTGDECVLVARKLSTVDEFIGAGIARAAADEIKSENLARALHIFDTLHKTNIAIHWVRRMTQHEDPRVRSRAAKMLGALYVNIPVIERQLDAEDARVRANAVEALWGTSTIMAKRLLQRAASDRHHRVAANGLLGLFLANDPDAEGKIIQAAQSVSPEWRAAMAWAMGKACSSVFVPCLEQLCKDEAEGVRDRAAKSLKDVQEALAVKV
jgi:HEAT repeat protein